MRNSVRSHVDPAEELCLLENDQAAVVATLLISILINLGDNFLFLVTKVGILVAGDDVASDNDEEVHILWDYKPEEVCGLAALLKDEHVKEVYNLVTRHVALIEDDHRYCRRRK